MKCEYSPLPMNKVIKFSLEEFYDRFCNGLYDIYSSQVRTTNPNGSIASLSVSRYNLPPIGDKLDFTSSITLVSGNFQSDNGKNLKTTASTKFLYNLRVWLNKDNYLVIRLRIFQTKNGKTTLVVNRTVREE
jgi:hypothetical protein